LVLDGVRLNNAIYRSGHLQNVLRIDQNSLQKAEVLYGPGALIYGSDALGGVVHFVTQKPEIGSGIKGNYSVRYSFANQESTNSIGLSFARRKFAWLGNYTKSNFGNLKQGKNRSAEIGSLGLRPFYQGSIANQDVTIINSDPSIQVGSSYQQENYHTKLLFQPNYLQQHIFS
jgi:hemoglobin/transferrin/lactoferrin receptor protein